MCRPDCGACCDPFVSPVAPIQLADRTADEVYGPDVANWMRAHLTPIRPRREALARARWMRGGWSDVLVAGQAAVFASHFYECDLFDHESRRCTDFAHRPAVCSGYPWYGDPPDPNKLLPPHCAYRADVGRPVEDVPVPIPRRGR